MTPSAERERLEEFLDDARAAVPKLLESLTDDQTRRRLVASLTTPLGLVTHLTFVEQVWFQVVLAGRTRADLGLPSEVDPTFTPPLDLTIGHAVAAYERVCDQSRRIAAAYPLDHVARHHRLGEVSLRWIYLHLIRETNRHLGHGDILREQLLDAGAGSQ